MSRLAIACVVFVAANAACSDDHDLLAVHPSEDSGVRDSSTDPPSDAAGNDAAAPRDGAAKDAAGAGSDGSESGPKEPPEPPGASAITLLNGIVDESAVRICFVPIIGDAEAPLETAPVPDLPSGSSFGQRWTSRALPLPGVDAARISVRPYVLTGNLAAAAGRNCAEILAAWAPGNDADDRGEGGPDAGNDNDVDGGSETGVDAGEGESVDATVDGGDASIEAKDDAPDAIEERAPVAEPLRVIGLPILPAGTLLEGRSYLLVLSGCVGGPGHDDPAAAAICGAGYSATAPTLTFEIVLLSRIAQVDALGFQAMHASLATKTTDVRLLPMGGSAWNLARLDPGVIAPRPPNLQQGASALGVSPESAIIDITTVGQTTAARAQIPLGAALSSSGLGLSDLVDGRNYTLVLLGAAPSVAIDGFGHPFEVTLVANDPALPTAPPTQ